MDYIVSTKAVMTLVEPAAWALAAFFGVGATANAIRPAPIRAAYARWGYPPWFPWLTASLELASGMLLLFARTRDMGLGLAAAVMMAATATLVRAREFRHATLPLAVLVILAAVAFQKP